jgi:adenylate cyclase
VGHLRREWSPALRAAGRLTRLRGRLLRAIAIGLVVSAAVTGLSRLGLFAGWEARAVDAFVFLREQEPAPDIVLVTIDEDAFRELGERQPLSRRYLADLGEFLMRSGARVVGFDIVVRTPTSADEDQALVEAVQRWARARPGAIVFASPLEPPKAGSAPGYALLPPFTGDLPALFGFASAPQGADRMVRRLMPLLPSRAGGFLPGFSLAVLAGAAGLSQAELSRGLGSSGGSVKLPIRSAHNSPRSADDSARSLESVPIAQLTAAWRVDYAGPPGTFTSFPSGPLVALARSGTAPDPDNPFRDRIVLVGATFAESRDFYATPAGLMAGVEIQANMVHTLLGRRALLPPPWPLGMALLAALCVTVSVLSIWLRPLWLTLAGLALSGLLIAVSWRAYARGYWLDFVAPLVAVLGYVQGSRMVARRRLRAAFGQYVSPEVLERVVRDGTDLGGEVRSVSVLMSDLRGFTTLSERLPPAVVSETISEYLTAMTDVILARGGYVIDFVGDGILAVFGVPLDDPEHTWHAVQTALGMQAALERLNTAWQAAGRAPLVMGVAVHTGEVFAGTLGAPRKKKYTVLGDPVNTTSRIEGLNRELGTAILISGAALGAVKGRVRVRDHGAVTVKGRRQPVELFELLALEETS